METSVLCLVFLLALPVRGFAEKVAIIDAGSSGSRLFIYELNADRQEKVKLVYPVGEEQRSRSRGRALSSVANHPDSVQVYLQLMTQHHKCDSIDLYILATAGMRLKPKAEAESLYDKLKALPGTNGYYVKSAMTISGQYEGLYAWLASNFDNGKLDIKKEDAATTLSYAGQPYGILEIGGASMQLAFASLSDGPHCLTRPGIGQIYSRSYLGGGVDQIYKKTKPGRRYKFNIEVDDDFAPLCPSDTKFLGLGIIEYVFDGMKAQSRKKTYKAQLNGYIKSLRHFHDTPENYHPRINAHYVKWLYNEMDLMGKVVPPEKNSSWTLGAAIDILINKMVPQRFDYTSPN